MLYNANTPFTSSHNKNKLCFKQMKQAVGFWGRYTEAAAADPFSFFLSFFLLGKGGDRRE
jgi:hypothetical protein